MSADGYQGKQPSEPEIAPESNGELLPGDWYFEGPYLVFTAQYHLRRGYCCGSGCRHCPYRNEAAG